MNASVNQCKYPVLVKYFNEDNYNEAIEHIKSCKHCFDKVFCCDKNLLLVKHINDELYGLKDENETANIIERSQTSGYQVNISQKEDISMNYESRMMHFLRTYNQNENIKTPDYLNNIVRSGLKGSEISLESKIIIKISDGLRLIGKCVNDLLLMPDDLIPVTVRSGQKEKTEESPAVLNFVQILNNQKIHYNVIKDGPESILLTLKFDEQDNKPNHISLRSMNQVILSQQMKRNYAFFSKLKEGEYSIELKYLTPALHISIPVSLL